MKKEWLFGFLFILLLLFILSFVNANPYSYDNSMDLKYNKIDGKIIYGYGDGVKYETNLRPKGLNWSEWRKSGVEISKRKVILNKTWAEIESEKKLKTEETSSNNVITNLIDKVNDLFLKLIGKEK